MLLELIPFYLAVQLGGDNQNNDKWKNGPEYNFSGSLKMITSLEQDMGITHGTGVYVNLICRPREQDSLRCQIENSTIVRLKPQGFDVALAQPDPSDKPRVFNIINVPFEIKFNKRGIDSFIFDKINSPPLPPLWSINQVRLIANQLNIGIDISNEMISDYKALENFTIGECQVDFKVVRRPVDRQNYHKIINKTHFELMPLERLGQILDDSIEIRKKRNVNECLRCTELFFGSRYTLGLLLRDVLTKLKKSESVISLSKYHFTSETINESDVYDQDRKQLGRVLDHMKITLESVTEAKDQLVKFSNPLIFDVVSQSTENTYS